MVFDSKHGRNHLTGFVKNNLKNYPGNIFCFFYWESEDLYCFAFFFFLLFLFSFVLQNTVFVSILCQVFVLLCVNSISAIVNGGVHISWLNLNIYITISLINFSLWINLHARQHCLWNISEIKNILSAHYTIICYRRKVVGKFRSTAAFQLCGGWFCGADLSMFSNWIGKWLILIEMLHQIIVIVWLVLEMHFPVRVRVIGDNIS